MSSMERLSVAMAHREPDRVPLLLATTMHGARELGLTIEEYFGSAKHVIEGQLRLRARYRSDFLLAYPYAAVEMEAWGAQTIFLLDGPPQAGQPVIGRPEDIDRLQAPEVASSPSLQRVLATIRGLREQVGDAVPVISAMIAPFSLPIMQMGFAAYLDLMHDAPERFWRLMEINEQFTVAWAQAQCEAGVTALVYYDPCSSTTIVPPELYRRTGCVVARHVMQSVPCATATHFASGRCAALLEDVVGTGTAAVAVGMLDSLEECRRAVAGRATLIGNLNAVEMRHWSVQDAEHAVKRAIAAAGRGGGFVLCDGHGEIPWQVPEAVLEAISESVERWGRYPLDWIDQERDVCQEAESWRSSAS